MELPVSWHSFYAFIPGYSVQTYTDEQLQKLNEKENEEKYIAVVSITPIKRLKHSGKWKQK